MTASGQLRGRLRAVSRGRRQSDSPRSTGSLLERASQWRRNRWLSEVAVRTVETRYALPARVGPCVRRPSGVGSGGAGSTAALRLCATRVSLPPTLTPVQACRARDGADAAPDLQGKRRVRGGSSWISAAAERAVQTRTFARRRPSRGRVAVASNGSAWPPVTPSPREA